jgi:hypothetical protein
MRKAADVTVTVSDFDRGLTATRREGPEPEDSELLRKIP